MDNSEGYVVSRGQKIRERKQVCDLPSFSGTRLYIRESPFWFTGSKVNFGTSTILGMVKREIKMDWDVKAQEKKSRNMNTSLHTPFLSTRAHVLCKITIVHMLTFVKARALTNYFSCSHPTSCCQSLTHLPQLLSEGSLCIQFWAPSGTRRQLKDCRVEEEQGSKQLELEQYTRHPRLFLF